MSAVDAEAELSVFDEVVAERDAARADAYEKVHALAAVSGILLGNDVPPTWDHYGAVADARKCARERDEAVRAVFAAGFGPKEAPLSALVARMAEKLREERDGRLAAIRQRDERLRDALEEIAGMCSENAKQMQAIAQDALGSMPPSNLPYICPKSVAVAEDLTPGEVTSEAEEERDLLRAQLAVATATIADWARVTGCETPDDFEATR